MTKNPLNQVYPWLQTLTSIMVLIAFIAGLFWFLLDVAIDQKIVPELQAINANLTTLDRRVESIETYLYKFEANQAEQGGVTPEGFSP